jgi:hypothetical protein
MSNILKNAKTFLQKRFSRATVINREHTFSNQSTGEIAFKIWPMIAQDPDSGVKQRAIAFADIGLEEIKSVAVNVNNIFKKLDEEVLVNFDNILQPTGHAISTNQMTFASNIILYTNNINATKSSIINVFSSADILIEIINESKLYNTVFISYGGTDEAAAASINMYLKSKGIKTWFFRDDSHPGQKLHRMMHDGVNDHDRVLCICSEQSLTRPGVLNELERVLEREAREGGSEILIPITLDDYIFGDWAPERLDIANQIRSRTITKIDIAKIESEQTQEQLQKLVQALSKF